MDKAMGDFHFVFPILINYIIKLENIKHIMAKCLQIKTQSPEISMRLHGELSFCASKRSLAE